MCKRCIIVNRYKYYNYKWKNKPFLRFSPLPLGRGMWWGHRKGHKRGSVGDPNWWGVESAPGDCWVYWETWIYIRKAGWQKREGREGKRKREVEYVTFGCHLPGSPTFHLHMHHSLTVIFPLWVIYGLVSCLCTLSHLIVTCISPSTLSEQCCNQRPTECNFWSKLSFKEQLRTVSYQQGAACEVLVPLSIRDVQRLNTVCSEQLLSKYEDFIDTRSNIGHSEETGLFALVFPLCIYLSSADLDFVYS